MNMPIKDLQRLGPIAKLRNFTDYPDVNLDCVYDGNAAENCRFSLSHHINTLDLRVMRVAWLDGGISGVVYAYYIECMDFATIKTLNDGMRFKAIFHLRFDVLSADASEPPTRKWAGGFIVEDIDTFLKDGVVMHKVTWLSVAA